MGLKEGLDISKVWVDLRSPDIAEGHAIKKQEWIDMYKPEILRSPIIQVFLFSNLQSSPENDAE